MRLYYQIPVEQQPELLDIVLEISSIMFRSQSGKVSTCRICVVNWRDVSNYICFVVKGTKSYACTLMFVLRLKLIGSRRLLDLKTVSDHIALGACWETVNYHIALRACWI